MFMCVVYLLDNFLALADDMRVVTSQVSCAHQHTSYALNLNNIYLLLSIITDIPLLQCIDIVFSSLVSIISQQYLHITTQHKKMVRKKLDERIRTLFTHCLQTNQRGLLLLVGDHGKDQVPNLYHIAMISLNILRV